MTDMAVRTLVAVDGHVAGDLVELVIDDPRVAVSGVGDLRGGWPRREDAEALLVICVNDSDDGLELVRQGCAEYPGRPVVVACQGSPNGYLHKAFAVGAEDVVAIGSGDRVGETTYLALAKAVARNASEAVAAAGGHVVTVLGTKGGTGKTLVATNLAVALSARHQRAVVVDLDLQFGDVGLAMGLHPDRTIADLAHAGGRPDAQKLEGYLAEHPSGAAALLAPTRPDLAALVKPDQVRDVLRALRGVVPFVIVDTPPAFTPEVLAALDESTDICIVAMLDALSLKNTKIALETLDMMGVRATTRLVLNRSDTHVGITHADVVRILGRAPDVLVPSNRDVVRAVNAGESIVLTQKRNDSAKALRALAGLYLAQGD
jgi:pilus assembly protein CpaE